MVVKKKKSKAAPPVSRIKVGNGPEQDVRQYELLAPPFIDGSGSDKVRYEEAGEIIEHTKPLDKMFPNKFRLVGNSTARRPHDRDETLDQSGRVMDRPPGADGDEEDEEDDGLNVTAAKKPGKTLPKKVQTSPADNDFADEDSEDDEEESEEEETDEASEGKKAEEAPEPKMTKGGKAGSKSSFGKEMTAQFAAAGPAELRVYFKKGVGFTVVDGDRPDKPLPHGDGLKSKKEVAKFLSDYRKS